MSDRPVPGSRHLVYQMLGKRVDATLPAKGGPRRTRGVVQRVYRNPLDGELELTVDGKRLVIQEPDSVRMDGKAIVLSYGRPKQDADADVFEQAASTGESIHDVLQRTEPPVEKEFRIHICA